MLFKVNFPNGTHIIVEENIVTDYFGLFSDIDVEEVKEQKVDKKTQLNNASFSSLVGAIDAKWGFSYEPVSLDDQPWDESIRAYMDKLVDTEGDHYPPTSK